MRHALVGDREVDRHPGLGVDEEVGCAGGPGGGDDPEDLGVDRRDGLPVRAETGDLVVASDRARFFEISSKRGLSVDFGGSWLLVQRVGLHRAKELCLLAEVLPACRAAETGLVNQVVPVEGLYAGLADWADRLAAGPPVALTLTKRLLDQAGTASSEEALDREAHAQSVNLLSLAAPEAFAAFRESGRRRSPGVDPAATTP